MEQVLLIVFCLLLFFIFLYSLSQLHLLVGFMKSRRTTQEAPQYDFTHVGEIPLVTIQLPLYNEKEVAERLLRNIVKLEYPKEKLEIQVLDDSTDETPALVKHLVEELRYQDLDITYLYREIRENYKAGALREGLKSAKGEFIVVFDSDFLPGRDWLLKTVPYFKDGNLGVVQTRWGHLNREYSLLTRLQAFALDFHFILEQNGRNGLGCFINFNGTAGIWRKACILDSGNWQGDTLTEDLDLSYRAQMRGWKIRYLSHLETPAELPVTLEAVRSQQFRWNKGAAENFQKSFPKLFLHKKISFKSKIHGFFHLLNSSLFLLVLCLAILSFPVLLLGDRTESGMFFELMLIFSISPIIFFIAYWIAFTQLHGASFRSFIRFIGMFFVFFSVAMGLSLHNSIAVLEGHFGKKSEFVRTPKFNILGKKKFITHFPKRKKKLGLRLFIELLLFLYFLTALIFAFVTGDHRMLLFHLMLCVGFGFILYHSLIPPKTI